VRLCLRPPRAVGPGSVEAVRTIPSSTPRVAAAAARDPDLPTARKMRRAPQSNSCCVFALRVAKMVSRVAEISPYACRQQPTTPEKGRAMATLDADIGRWLSVPSFASPQRPIPMGARICRQRVRCEYTTSRTFCSPISRHRAQFETYAFAGGRATIHSAGGPIYETLASAFRSEHGGAISVHDTVLSDVIEATPVLSPVYMFIAGVTEERLRAAFTRRYGVGPIAELPRGSSANRCVVFE
jgi:hypothetical protein